MTKLAAIKHAIKKEENKEKAAFLMRFFKTGKGQYGENDLFLGLTVPKSRKIASEYNDLPLKDIEKLLMSSYHEERLIALLILVLQFLKADVTKKKEIFEFYLSHTKYINNWDLVDLSADKIVGEYLYQNCHSERSEESQNEKKILRHAPQDDKKCDSSLLKILAHSENLWERRIAMIATFQFLKQGDPKPTIEIANILLHDKNDLIQKAVGWMLREMGKRCGQEILIAFLAKHYKTMPRTALRYSIEHFPEETRKKYLLGTM